MRLEAIAALLLCGVASGCVLSQTSNGVPLSEEQVAAIAVGESTRQHVARLLGPPDEIIYSNREHDRLVERASR